MDNTNEVIVIALKDFEVAGMNYVAGSKYALTTEVIATLEEGTVELVATEPTPEPEVVVEETPTPEVTQEEVNQVSPEETPVVSEDPAPTEPTVPEETAPEANEAPVEEPKPWAGNHEVAK